MASREPSKAPTIVERVEWGVAVAAYTYKSPSGQEVRAPGGVLRVALDFVNRCNSSTGLLNPSLDTISDDVNIDRRTVSRSLKWMLEHGFLTSTPGGGRSSSRYFLTSPASVVGAPLPPQANRSRGTAAPAPGAPLSFSRGTGAPLIGRNREPEQGETRSRVKTRPQNGKREVQWSQTLGDLIHRRLFPSHLTGAPLLPVAVELSISTIGLGERQMRSAIEERLQRLRTGETLEDLADKKGGGGPASAVDYVARRLMFEFPENAPEVKAQLVKEYGKRAFDVAWVKVQCEQDDKFYPALMAELEEIKEVTTCPKRILG